MNIVLLVMLSILVLLIIFGVIVLLKVFGEVKNVRQELCKTIAEYKQNKDSVVERLNWVKENTERQVNLLRLDNVISLTNEVGKYVEGKIEDDIFIKNIGYFRISKLIDKESGDVTVVYYDDEGVKTHTETFNCNNKLKYAAEYEKGKLSHGIEYNETGKVIFEYEYDGSGEINSRTEYVYNQNGDLNNKMEKKY